MPSWGKSLTLTGYTNPGESSGSTEDTYIQIEISRAFYWIENPRLQCVCWLTAAASYLLCSRGSLAVLSAVVFHCMFSVNTKASVLISHFPGDSVFSSSLWLSPFSQLFPKVEVKFGKNEEWMYVRGTDPSFQDLKISMKGSQVHLCPSLFLFDFFNRKSDPAEPVSLHDCSKSGKARGTLAFFFFSLAKPVAFWSNPTALERQQIISAFEGLPADCSITEENVLGGLWGRKCFPLCLISVFTFRELFLFVYFFSLPWASLSYRKLTF